MRDGLSIVERGFPVVALITEDFWDQGMFVAQSLGLPGLPRVKLPHPVAGLGEAEIGVIATNVIDEILDNLAHD